MFCVDCYPFVYVTALPVGYAVTLFYVCPFAFYTQLRVRALRFYCIVFHLHYPHSWVTRWVYVCSWFAGCWLPHVLTVTVNAAVYVALITVGFLLDYPARIAGLPQLRLWFVVGYLRFVTVRLCVCIVALLVTHTALRYPCIFYTLRLLRLVCVTLLRTFWFTHGYSYFVVWFTRFAHGYGYGLRFGSVTLFYPFGCFLVLPRSVVGFPGLRFGLVGYAFGLRLHSWFGLPRTPVPLLPLRLRSCLLVCVTLRFTFCSYAFTARLV